MLWKVEQTKFYICGSVHVLKPSQNHIFNSIDPIYSSSARIVFESDTTNLHQLDHTLFEYPKGDSLKNNISSKLFTATAKLWRKFEFCNTYLNDIKPWHAANIIIFNLLAQHGFVEQYGIDRVLLKKAKADRKKVKELESINAPLLCFNSVPEEEQQRYLSETVSKPQSTVSEFKGLAEAIIHSDVESLTSYLRHYLDLYPDMFTSLVVERNKKWLPLLLDYMNDNIPTLIVVGALHCVDTCGLPSHLKDKGYTLSLLQHPSSLCSN